MILSGRVRVNGTVPATMPVLVDPDSDVITLDDKPLNEEKGGGKEGEAPTASAELHEQQKVYFLLNKPKGILVTSRDPGGRKTVGDLLSGVRERVFPVGRLEMDARGALILTNDGELANRLTHPRYGIEKTYVVEVDGSIGHQDLERIKRGVWLGPGRLAAPGAAPGGQKTEAFRLKLLGRERGRTVLELRLSEAKNSDIRRVMARFGHHVRDLCRVAIAGKITLKGLDSGEFRPLMEKEVEWLFHASSPEFHAREQAATQAWYEKKEMEKERRRLDREGPAPAEGARSAGRDRPALRGNAKANRPTPEGRLEKLPRARPERKGKKPFVPPTGRNAGKPLGGNYLGRKRLAGTLENSPDDPASPEISHPFGDAALSDE